MIKVKEFLDKNFKHKETKSRIKSNGHYFVNGSWIYNILQTKKLEFKKADKIGYLNNCITCICNDEKLQINIIIDGKNVNQYTSFTTSEDVERGEPDEFGYYSRSTDYEIINYIQHYINILNTLK
jgi:predicted small secreted protein